MNAELANVMAEEAVLGSMLADAAEAVPAVVAILDDPDFSGAPRATLFRVLNGMHERGDGISLVTVGDELLRLGLLDQVGGALELARLVERVPSSASAADHARIVRTRADRRRLAEAARRIASEAEDLQTPLEGIRLELPAPASGRADGMGLRFYSVQELFESSEEDPPYLMHELVPERAVTLLVGAPKSGKSSIAFSWIAAIERGEPWCGRASAKTSAVVLSEEGKDTLAQKARTFGVESSVFLTRAELLRVSGLPEAVNVAIAEARKIDARLIVVDPVAAWAKFPSDAEKDSGAVLSALAPLLHAATQGFAVLALHHTRKAPADAVGAGVRGSSAFFGAVETLIELDRVDRTSNVAKARRLSVTSRIASTSPELCVELVDDEEGSRFVAIGRPEDAKVAEQRRRLLDELAKAPTNGLTAKDLKAATRFHKQTVGKLVAALYAEGTADRIGGKGTPREPYRYTMSSSRSGRSVPSSAPYGGAEADGTSGSTLALVPATRNPSEPMADGETELHTAGRVQCGGEDDDET